MRSHYEYNTSARMRFSCRVCMIQKLLYESCRIARERISLHSVSENGHWLFVFMQGSRIGSCIGSWYMSKRTNVALHDYRSIVKQWNQKRVPTDEWTLDKLQPHCWTDEKNQPLCIHWCCALRLLWWYADADRMTQRHVNWISYEMFVWWRWC